MFVIMKPFFIKYYIPIFLVLINVFIKSFYIENESISHDEPFTIYHAQFDFFEMIDFLKNYNNPPLFEVVLHFWIKFFGISVNSVRVLPILFSSFSVFFIYKIGKDFFSEKIAIVSSVLFTFSRMQIWYAHDCRVYSLFLLLTVISFYLFFKLLKDGRLSKINFVYLIIVNSLIIYAHYFGMFVWFLQGLIVVTFHLKNKYILKTFFAMILFCSITYVPQILTLLERFTVSAKGGTWLKAPSGLESIYNMIWTFCNAPVVTVLSIGLLIVGLVKFIGFSDRKIQNPFVKYVIFWFVIPFFLMFFISYKIPMFLDRYLIFLTPAFYLLLAVSVSFLFNKKTIYYSVYFVLITSFVISSSLNPDKKRNVKDAVNFIQSRKNNRTIVLVCSPDFMTNFAYYYNQNYFKQIEQGKEYEKLEYLLRQDNIYFINHLDASIVNKINEFDKIIYFDAGADFSSPNNFIKQDLMSNFKLIDEKFYFELFYIYTFTIK